jgi:hypothetical protein
MKSLLPMFENDSMYVSLTDGFICKNVLTDFILAYHSFRSKVSALLNVAPGSILNLTPPSTLEKKRLPAGRQVKKI